MGDLPPTERKFLEPGSVISQAVLAEGCAALDDFPRLAWRDGG